MRLRLYRVMDRYYTLARGLASRESADKVLIAFVGRGYTDLSIEVYTDTDTEGEGEDE